MTTTRNLDAATHTYANFQPHFHKRVDDFVWPLLRRFLARESIVNAELRSPLGLPGRQRKSEWDLHESHSGRSLWAVRLDRRINCAEPLQSGFPPGTCQPSIYQRSKAYNADFINPAPHVGLAWNPSFQQGWLGSLLGDKKSVIRAGYSLSYYSEGMLSFTDLVGNNPGTTQTATLSSGSNFTPGSLSLGDALTGCNRVPDLFQLSASFVELCFRESNRWQHRPEHQGPLRTDLVGQHSTRNQRRHGPGSAIRREPRRQPVARHQP